MVINTLNIPSFKTIFGNVQVRTWFIFKGEVYIKLYELPEGDLIKPKAVDQFNCVSLTDCRLYAFNKSDKVKIIIQDKVEIIIRGL